MAADTGFSDAVQRSIEALSSVALEQVSDAVLFTDTDGVILWVSNAFTEMSGHTAQEAVGATLDQLLEPQRHGRALHARLWARVRAGECWQGQVANRHKDGGRYEVRQTIAPVRADDGEVTHAVVVHADRSEPPVKQTAYKELFDHVLDAILLFDDNGRHLEANPAACELTGYDRAELLALTGAELMAPDQLAAFRRDWARFLRDGRVHGSLVILHRDGRRVEVEYQAVADIAPGVHAMIHRDVTEYRHAHHQLRFQAELLDAVGDAVIATDADAIVRYWNAAAERLYGWSEEEALNRPIADLIVPLNATERGRQILDRLRRGEIWSGELDQRRRDDSLVPTLQTIAPILDEGGALAGIIGVTTDISELRRSRQQLARRAAQQAAVAELGQRALTLDDPELIAVEARATIARLMGADRRVEIHWDIGDDPPSDGLDAAVRVPIGHTGTLAVWDGTGHGIEEQDRAFLSSLAHILNAVAERRAASDELEHLASRDPITGLYNRTLLAERLEQCRAAARRSGRRYALLFLDLDRFKLVNDAFGHERGDEVLQAVADEIQHLVRPGDTVARFGGDEFAVLCPNVPTETAAVALADRIRNAIAIADLAGADDLSVSASIGIVIGDGASDTSSLLRSADTAMYRAKELGRNRIEVFDTSMHERVQREANEVSIVRHAVADRQVHVLYQPTVELATARIVGVEALARLELPDGELLSPDRFISVAEEIGLIGDLGLQVLEQACADARPWIATDPRFMLAVNLSSRQLVIRDHIVELERTIGEAEIDPEVVWFELTESALLSGPTVEIGMRRLRELGVHFAIDDFGTGYSSLARLRLTPVGMLKVDRSFVAGVADTWQDRALTAAAIELAHTFELAVTAEGVETPAQLAELIALGCELGQGYLWSPPVEAAVITDLLRDGLPHLTP